MFTEQWTIVIYNYYGKALNTKSKASFFTTSADPSLSMMSGYKFDYGLLDFRESYSKIFQKNILKYL